MDLAQYRRINNIIERDSADATYKYALLRGVIEICQQASHRSIPRLLLVHTIIIRGIPGEFPQLFKTNRLNYKREHF
jgi:hypothetical protein